jgi:hypothetical protein
MGTNLGVHQRHHMWYTLFEPVKLHYFCSRMFEKRSRGLCSLLLLTSIEAMST